jgi:hypothetical protein
VAQRGNDEQREDLRQEEREHREAEAK